MNYLPLAAGRLLNQASRSEPRTLRLRTFQTTASKALDRVVSFAAVKNGTAWQEKQNNYALFLPFANTRLLFQHFAHPFAVRSTQFENSESVLKISRT
mmetsp:Transcript_12357/g.24586  ORF Transcript_12357/g.24586 Transcript_12357/m.24586 type:complete len:98 (+) Transcript_12357:2183-2476(+)